MFEIFSHTADLGLRIRAADREALFADAARALFSVIVANLDEVRPTEEVVLEVAGRDLEYLFVDWLHELLFVFESRRLLLSEFAVRFDSRGLRAVVRGEPIDPERHNLEHEVKAITYHGLRVSQTTEGWEAEVIIDI